MHNEKERKALAEVLIDKHAVVVEEMIKRGLQHHVRSELDEKLPRYLKTLLKSGFPSYFVWIPNFVSVSGGCVYGKNRLPNDVDVIVRSGENFEVYPDRSLRLKVDRILEEMGLTPEWKVSSDVD